MVRFVAMLFVTDELVRGILDVCNCGDLTSCIKDCSTVVARICSIWESYNTCINSDIVGVDVYGIKT